MGVENAWLWADNIKIYEGGEIYGKWENVALEQKTQICIIKSRFTVCYQPDTILTACLCSPARKADFKMLHICEEKNLELVHRLL